MFSEATANETGRMFTFSARYVMLAWSVVYVCDVRFVPFLKKCG